MTMVSVIVNGRCDALVEGLRAEFGSVWAARIIESEVADFLWAARVQERYLGQHLSGGFGENEMPEDLSRVAFLSLLDGRWYTGICLVDGEGIAVDLIWQRPFGSFEEAQFEFTKAR